MRLAMVDLAVRPPRGIPQRGSARVSLHFAWAGQGCGAGSQPHANGLTRPDYP